MKLFVGNLSYETTEDELAAEFGTFGRVESVILPADKFSGRPRGFAFVEMPNRAEAEAAIEALNGRQLRERTLVVNESRPRQDNRGGSFGPNRRPGGGYGKGGRSGGGNRRRY